MNENEFMETRIKPVSYYQVSMFAHPRTGKHHLRRFHVNSKCEFVSVKDFLLTEDQYNKLRKVKKNHECKAYPTYDLRNVDPPNSADIFVAQSDMVGGGAPQYGYAPYNS